MRDPIQQWFDEAKGLKTEDESGIRYTLVDMRQVGVEWYFGLLSDADVLKYVNIDRYFELISVG